MKIGVLTYDYNPPIGGLGVVAKEYVERQKRSKNDILTVFSPSPDADDHVSFFARLLWKKTGGCPLFSIAVNLVLNSLVQSHGLDVLHAHVGSGGVFLLRKPHCPLVVTAHHTYFQEARLVYQHQPIKKRWKIFMSLLERRTYQLADRVTCVSKDTADALIEDYGIPREKISVVENGVSDAYFSEKSAPKDPSTIVFVGRLEERKGIWQLLDSLPAVVARFPKTNVKIIGKNLLGTVLTEDVRSKHLEDRVDLPGFLHETLRRHEMARASVVVVPSVLEGFGLVAAEAMALGCAVIVADCPGLRSLVEHGKTGLVVPAGNADALSSAVIDLLSHPEKAQALGASAKEEAQKRFRYDRGVTEVRAIYESVVR